MSKLSQSSLVSVPHTFPNDDSVRLIKLHASNGDYVNEGNLLAEVEFSKAVSEISSPCDGYVRFIFEEGAKVAVGEAIASVHPTQLECAMARDEVDTGQRDRLGHILGENVANSIGERKTFSSASVRADLIEPSRITEIKPLVSRAARALLDDLGLTLDAFSGKAFIRRNDIFKQGAKVDTLSSSLPSLINARRAGFSALKGAEITNLSSGANTLTSNFQKVVTLPSSILPENPTRVFTSMFVVPKILKQLSRFLKEYPLLNAYYSDGELFFYEEVSIGYALDLGNGLRIVCLGDVEERTEDEIRAKITSGVKDYLVDRLDPNDVRRSSFIVTDLLSDEVDFFIPLLGKDQGATLGLCGFDSRTASLKLSLTFDHRVTEGRVVASFLRDMKNGLT